MGEDGRGMFADVPPFCVAKLSAAMLFTMQDKRTSLFRTNEAVMFFRITRNRYIKTKYGLSLNLDFTKSAQPSNCCTVKTEIAITVWVPVQIKEREQYHNPQLGTTMCLDYLSGTLGISGWNVIQFKLYTCTIKGYRVQMVVESLNYCVKICMKNTRVMQICISHNLGQCHV